MSQLNKMKPITKVIIFLIIFAIIAVGVTVAAIFYTNRNKWCGKR